MGLKVAVFANKCYGSSKGRTSKRLVVDCIAMGQPIRVAVGRDWGAVKERANAIRSGCPNFEYLPGHYFNVRYKIESVSCEHLDDLREWPWFKTTDEQLQLRDATAGVFERDEMVL